MSDQSNGDYLFPAYFFSSHYCNFFNNFTAYSQGIFSTTMSIQAAPIFFEGLTLYLFHWLKVETFLCILKNAVLLLHTIARCSLKKITPPLFSTIFQYWVTQSTCHYINNFAISNWETRVFSLPLLCCCVLKDNTIISNILHYDILNNCHNN